MTEPLARIRHDFLPPDLEREARPLGVNGSIAIQARQSLDETQWLLELADKHPSIKGVVGWVDLRSTRLEDQLAKFQNHPRFVGVRHVVQDEPDDRFMLGEPFQRGIRQLEPFALTYDLLIFPRQLPAAIQLAERFPNQPFVLDHIAKPAIKSCELKVWSTQIQELARRPNVWCKVSGLVTEATWGGWRQNDFRPYLDLVFEHFGEDRLMFGSDWPVCLLSASYQEVFGIVFEWLRQAPESTRHKIFGANAAKFYRVKN